MNYFSKDELKCRHCGAYEIDEEFLGILNRIRADCGFPLVVTSGYRCLDHPIEAAKPAAGSHTTGRAVDIAVSRRQAHTLLKVALMCGITGIGVQQNGNKRFIHLDMSDKHPRPTVWSY
jgi:zinc D-Ala-D-Ala carboxypeptidase